MEHLKQTVSNDISYAQAILELFPLEDESLARDTRPLHRIRAYNSRQMDRREGAVRMAQYIIGRLDNKLNP